MIINTLNHKFKDKHNLIMTIILKRMMRHLFRKDDLTRISNIMTLILGLKDKKNSAMGMLLFINLNGEMINRIIKTLKPRILSAQKPKQSPASNKKYLKK